MAKKDFELSKAGLRFNNRVEYFNEDIEFVELLYRRRNRLLPSTNLLFEGMSADEPMLARKQVCTQSRTLVVAHLRATVYSSFFKDLYEEVTEYLRTLVEEAAQLSKTKDSAYTLIGNCKINLSTSDLLLYADIKDVHKRIADEIIRQLENERSTIKLIEKICERLSITVDKKTINDALPYLELRHILVHSDGKPDTSFKEKYSNFFSFYNGSVVLKRSLAIKAKESIFALIKAIDRQAVSKGIMKENNAR